MKKLIVLGIIIATAGLMFMMAGNASAADDTTISEIDINTTPEDFLFDISNMKPGDWAPRTVTIVNDGTNNFDYTMRIEDQSETDELYNVLQMEIKDSSNTSLYSGNLADFESLSPRSLNASEREELDVTIRFPEHLGNEFQGLTAMFSLSFYAVGEETATGNDDMDEANVGGTIGSNGMGGSLLPDTATNLYTFLLMGTLFVIGGGSLMLIKKIRNLKVEKEHV